MIIVENGDVMTNINGKTKSELLYDLAKEIFVHDRIFVEESIRHSIRLYNEMVGANIIKEINTERR